jgi:hypothetical protein
MPNWCSCSLTTIAPIGEIAILTKTLKSGGFDSATANLHKACFPVFPTSSRKAAFDVKYQIRHLQKLEQHEFDRPLREAVIDEIHRAELFLPDLVDIIGGFVGSHDLQFFSLTYSTKWTPVWGPEEVVQLSTYVSSNELVFRFAERNCDFVGKICGKRGLLTNIVNRKIRETEYTWRDFEEDEIYNGEFKELLETSG